jgi:hypothetical protein
MKPFMFFRECNMLTKFILCISIFLVFLSHAQAAPTLEGTYNNMLTFFFLFL